MEKLIHAFVRTFPTAIVLVGANTNQTRSTYQTHTALLRLVMDRETGSATVHLMGITPSTVNPSSSRSAMTRF